MLWFMIVPAVFGIAALTASQRYRKQRPPIWLMCLATLGPAGLGFVIFFIAWFTELPVAYTFTIMRMSGAKSASGVRASKLIDDNTAHWYTDDYYARDCGDYKNLTMLRLETALNNSDYYFAYDSITGEVVPMTAAAATRFPSLMPAGDRMANAYALSRGTDTVDGASMSVGNNKLIMPEKWFRRVTAGQKKPATN
jgi:hypothetical protein